MSVYNYIGGIRVVTMGDGNTCLGLDISHQAILFTDLPEGSTEADRLDYMNNDSVAIEFRTIDDVNVLIGELEALKKTMPQKERQLKTNV